jgi:hypothetical protein
MKNFFFVLGLALIMLVSMSSIVMADTSFGTGIGIPYGVNGLNLDINIIWNLDLSLGLGIEPQAGVTAYNIGGLLYLVSKENTFRPRLSYYYGTNMIVGNEWTNYKDYKGVTLGVGASAYFGHSHKNGLDFDLLYILSNEAHVPNSTDDTNGIKISIGYRRKF